MARPVVANQVASGEAKPAYPNVTVVPFNAIRNWCATDDELANAGGPIFVGMRNLLTKPANRAEEAEGAVSGQGNVSSDALEVKWVAVRAPIPINADGIAIVVETVDVAVDVAIVVETVDVSGLLD